jgi:uncharacterized protein YdhG (YjbR/CyaY superfamily)
MTEKPRSVDEYIDGFDGITRDRLYELKKCIQSVLPTATEKISYAIPCFWDGAYIVYFAGYAKHASIYPVHRAGLEEELKPYLSGKSTARFPHDAPLPKSLIKKITKGLYQDAVKRRKK